MGNDIIIYWGWANDRGAGIDLHPPTPLLKLLSSEFSKSTPKDKEILQFYLRCPASSNTLKNTFSIISPVGDISIGFKNNKFGYSCKETTPDLSFNNPHPIASQKHNSRLIDIHWNLYFFSESDIELTQYPAYLSKSHLTQNSTLYPGQFNISKWFRPIVPTYYLNSDIINISRGDDLYYINFNTTKKIKFKNFKFTNTLNEYSLDTTHYKYFNKHQPLNKIYDLFIKNKYNKRILKEIKNNLTGH